MTDIPPGHSVAYNKRKVDRQNAIDYWRAREGWTDAQFLKEFSDEKRMEAKGQADMSETAIKEDPDIEWIIEHGGSEEG